MIRTFKKQSIVMTISCFLLLLLSFCEGWSSLPSLRVTRPAQSVSAYAKHKPRTCTSSLQCHCDDDHDEHNLLQSLDEKMRKQVLIPGLALLASFSLCFFLDSQEAMASTSNMPVGEKYWSIMAGSSKEDKIRANEALLDYAVGTINTQYYDNTGGNRFTPSDFYRQWRSFRRMALSGSELLSTDHYHSKFLQQSANTAPSKSSALGPSLSTANSIPKGTSLDNREGAVQGLRWLVSTLNDPFSKYLTREELKEELSVSGDHGFLGTGAIVEAPFASHQTSNSADVESKNPRSTKGWKSLNAQTKQSAASKNKKTTKNLSTTKVSNLPVITAIEPDSPAERVGLVVGDRIVSVGNKSFLGRTQLEVGRLLTATTNKYKQQADLSVDTATDLVVAKPVYVFPDSSTREMVVGYRQSHLRVPTCILDNNKNDQQQHSLAGGDSLVHYELLSSSSGSIFDHSDEPILDGKVGYVRLTRFSKASTTAYLKAIQELEAAGAQSYIFDLRNNYGGKFQSALLLASSLIRDPHAILCYTMNARGAFTPHEVEEYAVDSRYPGYMLSHEATSVTLDQLHREKPKMFLPNGQVDWDPPSSYASVHEQVAKRRIHRVSYYENMNPTTKSQLKAQKKIVLLINEGTASSAEVFAAALRDNYRTVALVGTKSYGKGLIQHTFPTPDGGGLRLTIAEYLTPNLQHVTHVGSARFDRETGEFLGGGLKPDILCESRQGIPGNKRGDLCVGIALDALEEANNKNAPNKLNDKQQQQPPQNNGVHGGGPLVADEGQKRSNFEST